MKLLNLTHPARNRCCKKIYQKQQGLLLLRKKVRDLQDAQKLLTTAMLLGKVGVGIDLTDLLLQQNLFVSKNTGEICISKYVNYMPYGYVTGMSENSMPLTT